VCKGNENIVFTDVLMEIRPDKLINILSIKLMKKKATFLLDNFIPERG
jgi:hypothetical protein